MHLALTSERLEPPLFSARQDVVINEADSEGNIAYPTGTTEFSYIHEAADAIVVYLNGALLAEDDYTNSNLNNTVTLNDSTQANDLVTIYKVQSANDSGFTRGGCYCRDKPSGVPVCTQ